MFMLFLAAQNVACLSMIIAPTDDFRPESNLLDQPNSSMTATFRQSIWNTMPHLRQTEIELPQANRPKRNKVIWVILAMPLGYCGFDRCFMGQICCGFAKGFTCGGFMIWHLIDFWVCFVSCMSKEEEIHIVGYDVVFEKDTIDGAFIIATVFLIIPVIGHLAQFWLMKKQYDLQMQVQRELQTAMDVELAKAGREGDEELDIPRRHQSLAYIPTALTKELRKAGLVQETPTIPELIAAFDGIDKNGDGLLDHVELAEALGAMGTSDQTVDEMIKAMDTDGDGKISKAEFLIVFA